MTMAMVLSLLLQLHRLTPLTNALGYLSCICPNTSTFEPNSSFQSNLHSVLTTLSSNSSKPFGSSTLSKGEFVQGLYQCRPDVSDDVCRSCLSNATSELQQRCPEEKTAVIWYDECLVRFSDEPFLHVYSMAPQWSLPNLNRVPQSEEALFFSVLRADLNQCTTEAANSTGSKFAVKERKTFLNFSFTSTIYSMTQCTDDLSEFDCSQCLEQIVSPYLGTVKKTIGKRIYTPSCNFRFETYRFYNVTGVEAPSPTSVSIPPPPLQPSSPLQPPVSGRSGKFDVKIIEITIVVSVVLLLSTIVGCILVIRRSRCMHAITKETETTVKSLPFDMATLQAATGNFSVENLLGRGGFGQVFKGTLNNGQEIAVKRLCRSSNQGTGEFKNEVNLLVNLQHTNLVRLLGYCLESEERMLVYEFLSNKSLDYHLFDSEKQNILTWFQRLGIMKGIAQGILYLHEHSRLRIIHRDLKASNILLDNELKPKISDFGMAKIFGVDDTHSTTNRPVGTYGYMSPEYAMHGQYSKKSDVYSFGVIVLELVTGKKNNDFSLSEGCEDLISFVWKHWKQKAAQEVIDPLLGDRYTIEEVLRCIHIGLLCVQENAMKRPTMENVVVMTYNYSMKLRLPEQPALCDTQANPSRNWSEASNSVEQAHRRSLRHSNEIG